MVRGPIARWLGLASGEPRIAALNRQLKGYPRNHNFTIRDGRIVPSRRLRQRWKKLSALYPPRLGSFLDIGSCKGYFVLRAAARPDCTRAVGIDVHAPFVDLSRQIAQVMGHDSARFDVARMQDVADDPARFGGPFDTVQLVSTYHYVYWGSDLSSSAYGDHDAIMAMLARICRGVVIFANPLEVGDSPALIQEKAAASPGHHYNRAAFTVAAEKHFDIRDCGTMDRGGKRPMLVLSRRG